MSKKARYKVKNGGGSYDIVHFETSADQVKFDDGSTFQQLYKEGKLTGKQGAPGSPGLNGEPGKPGLKGETGKTGPSISMFNTSYSYSDSEMETWIAPGYTGTWGVSPASTTERVGDVVGINVKNTTRNGNTIIFGQILSGQGTSSLQLKTVGHIHSGAKGANGARGTDGSRGPAGPNEVSGSTKVSGLPDGQVLVVKGSNVGAKKLSASDVGAAPSGHTHDDRYVLKSGSELTGELKRFGGDEDITFAHIGENSGSNYSWKIGYRGSTSGSAGNEFEINSTHSYRSKLRFDHEGTLTVHRGDTGASTLYLNRVGVTGWKIKNEGGHLYLQFDGNGNKSFTTALRINEQSGDATLKGDLLVQGHQVYHKGRKPSASDVGAVPTSGGTITNSSGNQLTLKHPSGGSVDLTFDRGSGNSSWQIVNSSGILRFRNNWSASSGNVSYFDALTLNYDDGRATFKGDVHINGKYLRISAWAGYGSGDALLWYNANSKILDMDNVADININDNLVYHTGRKPTPSEIGAASLKQSNRLKSARDFTKGTLIQTDIDGRDGMPFYLEITGNAYNGFPPFDIKVQGYQYEGGIINYSATSATGNVGINEITAFNMNGKLHFWLPRGGYWQGMSVFCDDAHGDGTSERSVNQVIKITDASMPSSGVSRKQVIPIKKASYEGHNHDSRYQAKGATNFVYNSSYVGVRSPQRTSGQYYEFWDSNVGWAPIKAGDIYANGNKVYHAGNKPSAADINAADRGHTHEGIGDATMKIYPSNLNEINFGGNNDASVIYFGYRGKDSKPIPTTYVFGNTNEGSATVKAKKFLQNGQALALENHSHSGYAPSSHSHSNYLPTSGGTVSGPFKVSNNVIQAYRYGGSTNAAAITIDKPGDGCFGIGANGQSMQIQYGKVNDMNGAWSGSQNLTHVFKGQVETNGGNLVARGGYLYTDTGVLWMGNDDKIWYNDDSNYYNFESDGSVANAGIDVGNLNVRVIKARSSGSNIDVHINSGQTFAMVTGSATGSNWYFNRQWSGGSGTECSMYPSRSGGYGFVGASSYPIMTGYGYSWVSKSHRSYKYNISKTSNEDMYDYVKNLSIYTYRHDSSSVNPDSGKFEENKRLDLQLGCMVDELPLEVVNYDLEGGDGKGVDLYSYTTMVLGATKELQNKVEQLENEKEELLQKYYELEEKVNGIISQK